VYQLVFSIPAVKIYQYWFVVLLVEDLWLKTTSYIMKLIFLKIICYWQKGVSLAVGTVVKL